MLVLDPIPVIIDDLPDDYCEMLELPFSPKDPSMGVHTVPFTKTVYIDRSDFREVDSKDYFRLAPGKAVGLLKVPYPIKATSFKKDESTGLITEVHASYEKPVEEGGPFKKPKTYIQWVAHSPAHHSPLKAEVRIFNPLFKSDNPEAAPGGYLSDINPDNEEIYHNAVIETGFAEVKTRAMDPKMNVKGETEESVSNEEDSGPEAVRFQGLRVAYFCMDKDSTEEKLVLNRIVSLKEDSGKS